MLNVARAAQISVCGRKLADLTFCLIFSSVLIVCSSHPSVALSFCEFLVFFLSVVFVMSDDCRHADTCPSASVFSDLFCWGGKTRWQSHVSFLPVSLRLLFSSRFSKMVWIRDTCSSALPLSCLRVFIESVRVFGWRTNFKKPGRQRERKLSGWTGQRSVGL